MRPVIAGQSVTVQFFNRPSAAWSAVTRAPITTAIAAVPSSGLNHFIPGATNSIAYIFLAQFKQFLMIWLIISFVAISCLKHSGSNGFGILPTSATTNNLK
jgi:hypothetical protein